MKVRLQALAARPHHQAVTQPTIPALRGASHSCVPGPLPRASITGSMDVKVREVIRLLEADGWRLVRQRGSHSQYGHPNKPGTVTVAGKANLDVPRGTLGSILKQAGIEVER